MPLVRRAWTHARPTGLKASASTVFHKYPELVRLDKRPEILRVRTVAAFDALLEQDSVEATRIIKHKSERFAEVAKKGPSTGANVAPAQSLAETFVVAGRVTNALGRLRDRHEDSWDCVPPHADRTGLVVGPWCRTSVVLRIDSLILRNP